MNQLQLTPQTIQGMINDYKAGMKLRDMAAKYYMHADAIRFRMKKLASYGVNLGPRRPTWRPVHKKQ